MWKYLSHFKGKKSTANRNLNRVKSCVTTVMTIIRKLLRFQVTDHYRINTITQNKTNLHSDRKKTIKIAYPDPSAALSRCLLFLNQLETWVVVSPVPSASSLFSRGEGYGLWVYQSRRTWKCEIVNCKGWQQFSFNWITAPRVGVIVRWMSPVRKVPGQNCIQCIEAVVSDSCWRRPQ